MSARGRKCNVFCPIKYKLLHMQLSINYSIIANVTLTSEMPKHATAILPHNTNTRRPVLPDHTVCLTSHTMDRTTGNSAHVHKRCALPSECNNHVIGCRHNYASHVLVRKLFFMCAVFVHLKVSLTRV